MNILNQIVTARKVHVEKRKSDIEESTLNRKNEPLRPFFLGNGDPIVIAECKKGSPSKGIFASQYKPIEIARDYEQGGAQAISVLTEPDFFWGHEQHLIDIRKKVSLPILRKDFIFDTYQITESWALGADAILLIAAILDKQKLITLAGYAHELGLHVLLEVHNHNELQIALDIPVDGIGINSRNLQTFTIDLEETKRLCSFIPSPKIAVAESGMHSPEQGKAMLQAGFRGFLVGEYFMTAPANERIRRVKNFVTALKSSLNRNT